MAIGKGLCHCGKIMLKNTFAYFNIPGGKMRNEMKFTSGGHSTLREEPSGSRSTSSGPEWKSKADSKREPKSEPRKKYKNIAIALVVFLLIVFIIVEYIYLANKTKVVAPGTNDNNIQTETVNPDSSNTQEKTLTANDYYQNGVNDLSKKDYNSAISNLSKAIELDPKNPSFYILKSEAEYSLGNKDQSVKTIEEGVAQNPDSGALNSRLDTLKKGPLGNDFNL